MTIKIEDDLPVPLKVLSGQQLIESRRVVMATQTTGEFYLAQASAAHGQFHAINNLCHTTRLLHDGIEYAISYDVLASAPRLVHDALQDISARLDQKQIAELSPQPPESSAT